MALLARSSIVLAALAGCYSPDVRDCTVQCAAADDCAAGQMCGTDGFCASPERAGTCVRAPQIFEDGGIDASDASSDGTRPDARPPHDAGPPPVDAPVAITLHIKIDGKGRVTMGPQHCDKMPPEDGDCTFATIAGVPVTLVATPYTGQELDKWTTAPCAGQDASCSLTPTMPTLIGVKFRKHDGDDH